MRGVSQITLLPPRHSPLCSSPKALFDWVFPHHISINVRETPVRLSIALVSIPCEQMQDRNFSLYMSGSDLSPSFHRRLVIDTSDSARQEVGV